MSLILTDLPAANRSSEKSVACPFCGGKANLMGIAGSKPIHSDFFEVYVQCGSCSARSGGVAHPAGELDDRLIAHVWNLWNRRSQTSLGQVKPLTWRVDQTNGDETHFAHTIVGKYAAWMRNDRAIAQVPAYICLETGRTVIIPGKTDGVDVGEFFEDALDYCQDHFNRQVLSLLS
jgi:hypothetical protein